MLNVFMPLQIEAEADAAAAVLPEAVGGEHGRGRDVRGNIIRT